MLKITENYPEQGIFCLVNEGEENPMGNYEISHGETVLEAVANMASNYYTEGSAYWHSYIAGAINELLETAPEVLNRGVNPFAINEDGELVYFRDNTGYEWRG